MYGAFIGFTYTLSNKGANKIILPDWLLNFPLDYHNPLIALFYKWEIKDILAPFE
jgi:hypothetical protein